MTDEPKQPPEPASAEEPGKPTGSGEKPETAVPGTQAGAAPPSVPGDTEPASGGTEPPSKAGPASTSVEKPAVPAAPVTPAAPVQDAAVPQPKDLAAPPKTVSVPPQAAAPAGTAPSKPAAPAKPATPPAPRPVVKPEPWSSLLLEQLDAKFPAAISNPLTFRNQPYLTVGKEWLIEVCEFLKSNDGGSYAYLVDETAVDYPKREKRFEIIYILYSFKLNHRLRLKVLASENEKIPSVSEVWTTAGWLEREVYDMFGIQYEGHPDLRRILLPEDWVGYPLRKDYDILKQDDAWVQANLGIESGQ
jgi:NADH-quinone oxidoreductase subunit C